MRRRSDVSVIGAGVIGLSAAVELAEHGAEVLLLAEQLPGATSLAAGALWGPYLAEPKDRVRGWAARSLRRFTDLAAHGTPGVQMVYGVEASRHSAAPAPDFADLLPDAGAVDPHRLPAGFASGIGYTAPLIDMPPYLDYLADRLRRAGGRIQQRRLHRLTEALQYSPVAVNCTGLGAAALVPDDQLTPIRGQLVVVDNPGVHTWFSEDTGSSPDLLHWYPQGRNLVLGGLAVPGDWNTHPDPVQSQAILARCAAIEPLLAGAEIRGERTGLRPTRASIRLQTEQHTAGTLIHCYGHGGAGVTLSWGCAEDITAMIT